VSNTASMAVCQFCILAEIIQFKRSDLEIITDSQCAPKISCLYYTLCYATVIYVRDIEMSYTVQLNSSSCSFGGMSAAV